MIAIGIDPGFASLGYVFYSLDLDEVITAGVVRTRPDRDTYRLARDDNARRYREIWQHLEFIWPADNVETMYVEGMSQPRGASAAWKLALGWGVVLGLAAKYGAVVKQYGPMEIKEFMCGNKSATKDEVEMAVCEILPGLQWPSPRSIHEHMSDACGALLLGLSERRKPSKAKRNSKR